MDARAHGDAHRVAAAEERVAACAHRLAKAAVALDRVLVEHGDDEGRRRRLVEGALRLTGNVGWPAMVCPITPANE